jgi:hypothetical protein
MLSCAASAHTKAHEEEQLFFGDADRLASRDDDFLLDHPHSDLFQDSLWDPALQKCDICLAEGDVQSPMHSSVTCGRHSSDTAHGYHSSLASDLAVALHQRDEALRKCSELQAQVDRLRFERDALWGSGGSDDSFEGCFR